MLEKENAHVNEQEEITANAEKSLVAAPTSHIIAPGDMCGLEELGREDFTLARIKLLQAMSDEVSNGEGNAGDWFNTLSRTSYGTSFIFVPVTVWKSRVHFAEDRGEQPICRSADGRTNVDGLLCSRECPHPEAQKWIDGNPPLCAQAFNYLLLPVNDDIAEFPAIVTLMKSSFQAGRKLNTLLMAARTPAWVWTYEFYAVKQSNAKGTFYVATVAKNVVDGKPVASDEETRELAEQFYRMSKTDKLRFDDEEETSNEVKEENADDISEANVEFAIEAEKAQEENSAAKVTEIFEEEPDENVASHLATMVENEAAGLEPDEDLPF